MRVLRILLLLFISLPIISTGYSKPKAKDLHSYFNSKTKSMHTTFNIHKNKYGIFWGPCGPLPVTYAWSYDFDMIGEGPEFIFDKIELKEWGGKPEIMLKSGSVVFDEKREKVDIKLTVLENGIEKNFSKNGEYKTKKRSKYY